MWIGDQDQTGTAVQDEPIQNGNVIQIGKVTQPVQLIGIHLENEEMKEI